MRIHSERPKEPVVMKKSAKFKRNRFKTKIFNLFYWAPLKYNALTSEESLDLLIKSKKSLIRYGNGESEILLGGDMPTHNHYEELEKGLIEIIENYSENSNYLLALTNWCLTKNVFQLQNSPKRRMYRIWRFMRYDFWKFKMGKKNMPYLETDMFRVGPVGLPYEKIALIWKDIKNIIILNNNPEYVKWFREKNPNHNVFHIEIPDKNTFEVIDDIQNRTLQTIKENNLPENDLAIMVSAGPCSNIICYNLCEKYHNYLCYDMGNFFHMHYEE